MNEHSPLLESSDENGMPENHNTLVTKVSTGTDGTEHDLPNSQVMHHFRPIKGAIRELASSATAVAGLPMATVNSAISLLRKGEDGEPVPSGFVTFSRLSAVHAVLQMVQHEAPFHMEVVEAPDPDDGTRFDSFANCRLIYMCSLRSQFFGPISGEHIKIFKLD
jgi:hypothetical protein